MFRSLLIANRGEIACRVAATARRLGIRTVAVFSDADAGSAHVASCDQAIPIGAPAAAHSYLNIDALLAAARAGKVEAVHPGYGFLSENAAFAEACDAAGLVFVGPPSEAIRAMGDKREAKRLMRLALVPLIPGYEGEDEDPDELRAQARRIGFPLLIKAAMGGGGRGIRIVSQAADFDAALAACRREALAAFGDGRVLLERHLAAARHIEVQVFADCRGECVYLHERDCSAQRRHQKIIEEAPAPGLSAGQRRGMGEAAVAAARAVGYRGAGTVEFLLDAAGDFHFMEMNTRLQVEHPVTEMITGLDLVEWQLRVAAGEPLPLSQAQIAENGHAFEARIYAEDPQRDFLPSTGRIVHLSLPPHVAFSYRAPGATAGEPAPVRIDAALRCGDQVTPHYDAMIAKLITWGPDRATALAVLRDALRQVQLAGPANNVDFLQALAASGDFSDARIDTGWIGRELPALLAEQAQPDPWLAAACAQVLAEESASANADPWSQRRGWRLNGYGARHLNLRSGARQHAIRIEYRPHGAVLELASGALELQIESHAGAHLALRLGGQALQADVVRDGETLHAFVAGRHQRFLAIDPVAAAAEDEDGEDRLCAPMPGRVIAVHVSQGDRVARGQCLMVIEAMKMEHAVVAPHEGVVEELRFAVGDLVAEGATLIAIAPAPAGTGEAKP